jgi:glutamine amidotransferase
MIAVIDYGLGNIHSVLGAVEKVGGAVVATRDLDVLAKATKLILPGVGAFGDGMACLRRWGLVEPLTQLVMKECKPILGICLGCQLMSKESFEFGHHTGLSWLNASVVRLEPRDPSIRVPHVGWDDLRQTRPSKLFDGVPADALMYYTHSYHLSCHDPGLAIGECDYGGPVTSAVANGNVYGTQFHPEKSQAHGLRILKNFLDLC